MSITCVIDLSKLVIPNKTDSISGRGFGEGIAEREKVMQHLEQNDKFIMRIDSKKVKAINDSFIKGFFSEVFRTLKSRQRVREVFELDASDNFKRLFEKNWAILEAINAAA